MNLKVGSVNVLLINLQLKTIFDQNLRDIPISPEDTGKAVDLLKYQLEEINSDEEKVKCLGMLGTYQRLLIQLAAAEDSFNHALSILGSDLFFKKSRIANSIRLGHVKHWKLEFENAHQLFDRCIKEIKNDSELSDYLDFAYQHKGKCCFDEGKLELALACFEEALKIRTKKSDGELTESTLLAIEETKKRLSKENKHQVVAAVICKDNKFLMGKRSLSKKSGGGFWSPVCGRIEVGESQAEAIEREVYEEVGLKVKAQKKVAELETRDKTALIHWWTVHIIEGDPCLKNDEHSDLRWLSTEEMQMMDQVFSEDIELFKKIENLNL